MPVRKCSNGKYRIGSGDCIYTSKASAERAYAGYRAAKYSESVTPVMEDIHNPTFNYGNLVELMTQMRAAGPSEQETLRLDAAFNANDSIMFLGALGAAEISGRTDYGYQGGDVDTEIPNIDYDPNIQPGWSGYSRANTGAIRLNTDTWISLMQGTPTIGEANTLVHEIMHRGFAILHRMLSDHNELRTMLPSDLFNQWRGGWGRINYRRFPRIDVYDQQGQPLAEQRQTNPEHAMIYAMTTTPNSFYDQNFVQVIPQLSWGQAYFTPEWHGSFNNNYDDLTRDRPTTDIRRIRTYWRILYFNTERGLSRFLRTVLRQPANIPASPRPQPRSTTVAPTQSQRPAPRNNTLADLLGVVPQTESLNRTRKKS